MGISVLASFLPPSVFLLLLLRFIFLGGGVGAAVLHHGWAAIGAWKHPRGQEEPGRDRWHLGLRWCWALQWLLIRLRLAAIESGYQLVYQDVDAASCR